MQTGRTSDPVFAGVAHDLGRRVEAHGLRVQQRAGEDAGVVALEPGRGIDQQREAGGVAFGEAVGAEALDLGKAALGEILVVAVRAHAAQEAGAELADVAVLLEGGERAAQAVGLLRGEARADDGDLHRLFLEQRHAQRLAQHLAQRVGGEAHLLLAVSASDEGMHHVALDRAGADDRDLDHEVVEQRGRIRGRKFICARLSTWKTPRLSDLHSMS
jgi:hypothetical protein